MTDKSVKRLVAVYSGSFDPIHVGHVSFCLEAARVFDLDKVVLMPEPNPRSRQQVSSIEHRMEMARLATGQFSMLQVLEPPDQTFSIQYTLPRLRADYNDAELWFLLGSDVVETLDYRWPGVEEFLSTTVLAVGLRGAHTREFVDELFANLARTFNITIRYHVVPAPHLHLAATHIRMGTHDITDIDPAVADYIRTNRLFVSAD